FRDERRAIRIGSRRIERAEVLAEGDELGVRKILPVENHDQPFAPGAFDGVDFGMRHWLGYVDSGHFGAQRGVQIVNMYSHGHSLPAYRRRAQLRAPSASMDHSN